MARLVLIGAALVLLSGCFFIRVRDEGGDRSDERPAAEQAE